MVRLQADTNYLKNSYLLYFFLGRLRTVGETIDSSGALDSTLSRALRRAPQKTASHSIFAARILANQYLSEKRWQLYSDISE